MTRPETYTVRREQWLYGCRAWVQLDVRVEVTSYSAQVLGAEVLGVAVDTDSRDVLPVWVREGDYLDDDQALEVLGAAGDAVVCREARALYARDVTERAAL